MCVIELGLSEPQEAGSHTEAVASGLWALIATVRNRDREGSEESPSA